MAIKKYSKVKFTLRKELIFILAGILLLVVGTILFNLPTEEEKTLEKWNNAGSTITDFSLFDEVSFSELNGILDSKQSGEYTYVLYASPADANSVTLLDQIHTIVTSSREYSHITKIYIVDSSNTTENDFALENFKDTKGESINLETAYNLWLFEGKTIVNSINRFTDNSLTMDHSIIAMLNKTHA